MTCEISSDDKERLSLALQLVSGVFMEYEAPEYNAQGVKEFMRFIEPESISEMLAAGSLLMWAFVEENAVRGVLAVRPPGHISLLFVDSRYHKQGIASALFAHALAALAVREKCVEMTVNSSSFAVGFYRKMGFIETDCEQTLNGIRFVPMKRMP